VRNPHRVGGEEFLLQFVEALCLLHVLSFRAIAACARRFSRSFESCHPGGKLSLSAGLCCRCAPPGAVT